MEQNTSLSLPQKRLAGNLNCLNCGTELSGPFCYYCGQPDKSLMRFFPVLVRELAEDFLDFDSRFMRTMKPLLFKPGRLTRDYLDGRRFRYTPPLRLYIFASIAFFFLAAMLAGSAVEFELEGDDIQASLRDAGIDVKSEQLAQEEFEEAKKAIENLDPALQDLIVINEEDRSIGAEATIELPFGGEDEEKSGEASGDDSPDWRVQFNDEPWDRETNPVEIPFLPDSLNAWINDEIEKSPEKGKAIEENPNLIIDQVFDVLPATLFILLPLAALIMKFWYLFARKYYIEHLIFALHNHSFLFVILLMSLLSNTLAGWLEPGDSGPVSTIVFWFNVAIICWIPVYFLLALKTVYRQGWILTLGKYFVVGTSYCILLVSVTTVVGLLSFLLL